MPDAINPYQPPQTDLVAEGARRDGLTWFSVSVPKLLVMSVLTLGLYRWYWFYKNWCVVRDQRGESVSPFWRSVFFVFFAYSLFTRMRVDAVERDQPVSWTAGGQAGLLFLAAIADNILSRGHVLDGMGLAGFIFIVLPVVAGTLPLTIVQGSLNALNGDPDGSANRGYTPGALVISLVGLSLWGLVALGMALS